MPWENLPYGNDSFSLILVYPSKLLPVTLLLILSVILFMLTHFL